jgi:hypothetical protein
MTKKENGYRANIGIPSLILIFIVMCLITFGLLSLSTAKNEWDLSSRNASAVTEYYRADSEGEEFYQMIKEKQEEVFRQSTDLQEQKKLLKKELGDSYFMDKGVIVKQIPMERSQALSIELIPGFNKKKSLKISKWKVIHTEEIAIDQSMSVWSGENTKE